MDKISTGKLGENIAVEYCLANKYVIIDRNYSKPRWGEIDIIAIDKNGALCFIEVKTRNSIKYGNPEDSISKFKLRSLSRSIRYYLLTHGSKYIDRSMKFLVISILLQEHNIKIIVYDYSDSISINL